MPADLHDKIEHFVIHLVAFLFAFSTISAAFLAYGVYQNNTVSNLKPASAVYAAYQIWQQTDWNGSTSSETSSVPWGTIGGWDKYYSGSGVTTNSSGFTLSGGGNIVSSVFDTGEKRTNNFAADNSSGLTLSAKGADSAAAVKNSVTWVTSNFCTLAAYRYVQYKIENTSGGSATINYVYMGVFPYSIYGTVRDSATGNPLSGVSINYGSGSTTTALLRDRNLVVKSALAAGPVPGSGYYSFTIDFVSSKQVTITASKTGYNSQTKTINLPSDACSSTDTNVDFSLTKASSSSGGTTTGNTSTTSSTSIGLTEFQQIDLPAAFTAAGSTTTDLSKVADPKKIENFTLDIPGKNKIVFKDALDLSAKSTADALKELDKYIKIDGTGVIELDSKKLPALNKKATLTMSELKYTFTPTILVDGKTGSTGVVSNIKYGGGTLTFDVSHFTRYEAAAKFELLAPVSTSVSSPNTIIKARISDLEASINGTFNDITLAKITPDPKTGEFTLQKLVFKEGENTLKLSGQSKLGKVAPLTVTFFYGTENVVTKTSNNENQALIVVLVVALAFATLLGYLIYRRKKPHLKTIFGGDQKKVQEKTEIK